MFINQLKIPKERVAVLIGKKGETKRQIEKALECKLNVDSAEGDVEITGEDTLGIFTAGEIIKAIGRGFNPEIALLLLKNDYVFEILNMPDYTKTKKSAIRLKGRVIGEEGKSRRNIEELTECYISVFGKTIAIIGEAEHASTARTAIQKLLSGSPHANVFRWLEKKKKELKMRELESRDPNMFKSQP